MCTIVKSDDPIEVIEFYNRSYLEGHCSRVVAEWLYTDVSYIEVRGYELLFIQIQIKDLYIISTRILKCYSTPF